LARFFTEVGFPFFVFHFSFHLELFPGIGPSLFEHLGWLHLAQPEKEGSFPILRGFLLTATRGKEILGAFSHQQQTPISVWPGLIQTKTSSLLKGGGFTEDGGIFSFNRRGTSPNEGYFGPLKPPFWIFHFRVSFCPGFPLTGPGFFSQEPGLVSLGIFSGAQLLWRQGDIPLPRVEPGAFPSLGVAKRFLALPHLFPIYRLIGVILRGGEFFRALKGFFG